MLLIECMLAILISSWRPHYSWQKMAACNEAHLPTGISLPRTADIADIAPDHKAFFFSRADETVAWKVETACLDPPSYAAGGGCESFWTHLTRWPLTHSHSPVTCMRTQAPTSRASACVELAAKSKLWGQSELLQSSKYFLQIIKHIWKLFYLQMFKFGVALAGYKQVNLRTQ